MTGARTGSTVGEALIDALEAEGVRHVFGIPGVHTIELYRGLGAASARPRSGTCCPATSRRPASWPMGTPG